MKVDPERRKFSRTTFVLTREDVAGEEKLLKHLNFSSASTQRVHKQCHHHRSSFHSHFRVVACVFVVKNFPSAIFIHKREGWNGGKWRRNARVVCVPETCICSNPFINQVGNVRKLHNSPKKLFHRT